MGKAVLLTEGDSPLGAALLRLFVSKGFSVVTTTAGESSAPAGGGPGVRTVAWNRRSPISARNLIVTALNALETIDEAYVLEPPCAPGRPLVATSSADIERALDDAKGPVFLVRELLSYFAGRSAGMLALASGSSDDAALPSALRECFRGLATSVLSTPMAAGIVINGFQAAGSAPEEFAQFIDKTLEEKARKISGHWFVLPEKGAFLQGVFTPQLKKA